MRISTQQPNSPLNQIHLQLSWPEPSGPGAEADPAWKCQTGRTGLLGQLRHEPLKLPDFPRVLLELGAGSCQEEVEQEGQDGALCQVQEDEPKQSSPGWLCWSCPAQVCSERPFSLTGGWIERREQQQQSWGSLPQLGTPEPGSGKAQQMDLCCWRLLHPRAGRGCGGQPAFIAWQHQQNKTKQLLLLKRP